MKLLHVFLSQDMRSGLNEKVKIQKERGTPLVAELVWSRAASTS